MNKKRILTVLSAFILASCAPQGGSQSLLPSEGPKDSTPPSSHSETSTPSETTSSSSESSSDRYEEGYSSGKSDGHSEGYEEGYSSGHNEGYEEGYDENEPVFSIHTGAQTQYLRGPVDSLPVGVDGLHENSLPKPISLSVPSSLDTEGNKATGYRLLLSTSPDMSEPIVYESLDLSGVFEIYNLNVNTRYYYQFVAKTSAKDYQTKVKTFFVDGPAPRNVYVDGVTNFRDLGGWPVEGSDALLPQGNIYRCGRLHNGSTPNITSKGKQEVKRLGIKTELDLRDPQNDGVTLLSSVVEGVDYYSCGLISENGYFDNEANLKNLGKTFHVLSDKTNYPLMFHCAIGTDRTGFVAFCMNALAGVSLENLQRDYVFSSFGNINGTRNLSTITSYSNRLSSDYGNASLSDNVRSYLRSIGLTNNEVDALKAIVLGQEDPHEHHASNTWTLSELNEDYHQHVCTDPDCGVVIEKEKHHFGEFQVETEPTPTKDGVGYRECADCGFLKKEAIPHTAKEFHYAGVKSYGSGTTFSFYIDVTDLGVLNTSQTEIIVEDEGVAVEGVTYEFAQAGSDNQKASLTIHLPYTPTSGHVISIKEGTALSDGTNGYQLVEDLPFTYDGNGYFPSFYKGNFTTRKNTSNKTIALELEADFSEFLNGQASDGLQPYWTSVEKGKPSNFTYTLDKGGDVSTIVNDNQGGTGVRTTTNMYWVAAKILRITISESDLVDGAIFTVKKGAAYADNAGHADMPGVFKKYILEKDLSVRYNASTKLFETI